MQTLTCQICGKEWERKPTPGTRPKTCSPPCAAEWKKQLDRNYYQENRERIIENVSKYAEANKDKISEFHREYYLQHREKIKQKRKEYREENAEYISAWQLEYRRKNADKLAQYFRDYAAENKDKINAWGRSRHARVKGAKKWEVVTREDVTDKYGWDCHICKDPIPKDVDRLHPLYLNLDHVVPLAHGGDHLLSNLRPSHASCNKQKSAKLDGWENVKPIIMEESSGT